MDIFALLKKLNVITVKHFWGKKSERLKKASKTEVDHFESWSVPVGDLMWVDEVVVK